MLKLSTNDLSQMRTESLDPTIRYCIEASECGLPPGQFPEVIELTGLFNRVIKLTPSGEVKTADGEDLGAVLYGSHGDGMVEIHIIND